MVAVNRRLVESSEECFHVRPPHWQMENKDLKVCVCDIGALTQHAAWELDTAATF